MEGFIKDFVYKSKRICSLAFASLFIFAMAFSPLAEAAPIMEYSIAPSNSIASASNVTYSIHFKSSSSAGAFVVDFCSNSPLIGQTCDAPTGFDVSSSSSNTTGFDDVSAIDDNTMVVTGSIASYSIVDVDVDHIANPDDSGDMYARIVTYDTKAHALDYQSEDIGDGSQDTGQVAMVITDTIAIDGDVPESMTFCLSGKAPKSECSDTSEPVFNLGHKDGDDYILRSSDVSTVKAYAQLSTNALNGAIVRMKSNAYGCGGMIRKGAKDSCDIGPAKQGDVVAGSGKFGVKTTDATDAGINSSGVLSAAPGSGYNNDSFSLNYNSDDKNGVTSPYGDLFLTSDNAPVNNKNIAIIFGASASNTTPAGDYYVNINLIATGKF